MSKSQKNAVDEISNAIDDRNRIGFVTGGHFSAAF